MDADWVGTVLIEWNPIDLDGVWEVKAPLTYRSSKGIITVMPGATTDGASIPRMFWRLIGGPLSGKYVAAAVIHDQLYVTHGANGLYTREEVDKIFKEAMLSCGVPKLKAEAMYNAVRVGGWVPWDGYSDELIEEQQKYIRVQK